MKPTKLSIKGLLVTILTFFKIFVQLLFLSKPIVMFLSLITLCKSGIECSGAVSHLCVTEAMLPLTLYSNMLVFWSSVVSEAILNESTDGGRLEHKGNFLWNYQLN